MRERAGLGESAVSRGTYRWDNPAASGDPGGAMRSEGLSVPLTIAAALPHPTRPCVIHPPQGFTWNGQHVDFLPPKPMT